MKKGIQISLPILLVVIALFTAQKIRNPVCKSPLIFFTRSKNNQPEAITTELISELGGLPKSDMDVHKVQSLVDTNGMPPIFPVREWHINSSSVVNSDFSTIFDDDPTYGHDFMIDVTYADGETAVIQYSSWSYGIVACPLLISLGSGPPGQLRITSSQN